MKKLNFTLLGLAIVLLLTIHCSHKKKGNSANEIPLTTIAGTGKGSGMWYGGGYKGDGGPAVDAELNNPADVCIDANGNLYVADISNNRVRRIEAKTGVITTYAGNGELGDSGDGGPATKAQVGKETRLCIDKQGNLLISIFLSNLIKRVDAKTGIITTICGKGNDGFSNDGALADTAEMGGPAGMCIDDAGNIFIAETGNNIIRKIDAVTHKISTVAGNTADVGLYSTTFYGDGGNALKASLNRPQGIAVDKEGNIYIADTKNNRIRKVDISTSLISTIAGNGKDTCTGDGGLATEAGISASGCIHVDAFGNVFFTDENHNRIRKIEVKTGIISTVAGNGEGGKNGDVLLATTPILFGPSGFCIDANGNIIIAEAWGQRIRKVEAKAGK